MKVLSVSNHKGGTGKTAMTRALGDYLAGQGYRVLIVDLDPQASLTMSCGYAEPVTPSMVDVVGGSKPGTKRLDEIIVPVKEGLDLAPSNLDLAFTEPVIVSRPGRDYIIKRELDRLAGYDLAILDCGPNIGTLTFNALVASDAVLIPTQPSMVDLTGVKRFIDAVDEVKELELNKDLEILGIVLTFFNERYNTHQAAMEAMQAAGWPVLDVTIGRSVRVSEAGALGQSVIEFEPNNPQAINYIELGRICEKWLRNKTR